MFDYAMLSQGFFSLFDIHLLWLMPLGLLYGMVVSAIPGMSGSLAIALVMPFTFHMTALQAIIFLSSIFTGSVHGGSIPAILLNMPGSPASAATVFDGFKLAREGKHNEAQGLAIGASTMGSLLGCILVLCMLHPLAQFALMFGPVEMLMVGVFALTIIASFKGESIAKGLMAGLFGLLIGTVGVSWGREYRATFGSMWLIDGLPVIPVLLGILALPGLYALTTEKFVVTDELLRRPDVRKIAQGFIESTRYRMVLLRSTLIGIVIGALPAAGASVASLLAWNDTKQSVKGNKLGDGDPRGVVASEAANNSSEMGSTAVMLALGIPGGGATAIMLGAFLVHGLTPGPRLLSENLHFGYAIFLAEFVQMAMMPFFAVLVLAFANYIVKVPNQVLVPAVLAVTCWGVFATRETFFDVGILIGFGIFGFILQRYGYPVLAMLLGFILAEILEPEMIRATATFGYWDLPVEILTRPISLAFVVLTVLSLIYLMRNRDALPDET
jgi:putative tricarboxylic transport membrane protein